MTRDCCVKCPKPASRGLIPVLLTTVPGPPRESGWKPAPWLDRATKSGAVLADRFGGALLVGALLRRETACVAWALLAMLPVVYFALPVAIWVWRSLRWRARVRAATELSRFGPMVSGDGLHAWLCNKGLCYEDGDLTPWRELSSYCMEVGTGRAHRLVLWMSTKRCARELVEHVILSAGCLLTAVTVSFGAAACLRSAGLTNDVLSALFLAAANFLLALHLGLAAPSGLRRQSEQAPPYIGLVNAEYVTKDDIVRAIGGKLPRWDPPDAEDPSSAKPD